MKRPATSKIQAWSARNAEAASVILADPSRYPAGSLAHQWAVVVSDQSGDGSTEQGNGAMQ